MPAPGVNVKHPTVSVYGRLVEQPPASVAVTVIGLADGASVGVPVIRFGAVQARPGGRAPARESVTGASPPVTVNACEYALPAIAPATAVWAIVMHPTTIE